MAVVGRLHDAAARQGWQIDPDQNREWLACIALLQAALSDQPSAPFAELILEYDFRRRGLRIDCLLLAPGLVVVIEFKRGKLSAGDREQVTNYCVNLIEFHKATQDLQLKLIPLLVTRKGDVTSKPVSAEWHPDWPQLLNEVVEVEGSGLAHVLANLLDATDSALGNSPQFLTAEEWNSSPFSPASTIVDAAVSLYGNHDVSAIKDHASAQRDIDACVQEVLAEVARTSETEGPLLIFVSGAPGAGKTLVGLTVVFSEELRSEAVFVTGNAPLVEVLNGSLQRSYRRVADRTNSLAGYSRSGLGFVTKNSDFKIVKAHRFLDSEHKSADGRILVFDEAQRTYAKGKLVKRRRLADHEANLILKKMSAQPGPVVVLLLGHNQHINKAERGAVAWLEAAETLGWRFAISTETLQLPEIETAERWARHALRVPLRHTHLTKSMRYYRNAELERWAHHVMANDPSAAKAVAKELPSRSRVLITRDLDAAKSWARAKRTGQERSGIIASGQARRLRAEGLHVGEKPDIVNWMLQPTGDVRSSSMLEQVQNQYQIQGLEIDYAIVCWDADLRREGKSWASYNIVGGGWQRAPSELDARTNSYRVLLTRSRKGMVVFIPRGDLEEADPTRKPQFYDAIYEYLAWSGAVEL